MLSRSIAALVLIMMLGLAGCGRDEGQAQNLQTEPRSLAEQTAAAFLNAVDGQNAEDLRAVSGDALHWGGISGLDASRASSDPEGLLAALGARYGAGTTVDRKILRIETVRNLVTMAERLTITDQSPSRPVSIDLITTIEVQDGRVVSAWSYRASF